jgi:hypothetical protein
MTKAHAGNRADPPPVVPLIALFLHLSASGQTPRPIPVVSISDNVVQVQLPQWYSLVHDKVNIFAVRPWLHSYCFLDVPYSPANPHSAVPVLHRKPHGQRARAIDLILIVL